MQEFLIDGAVIIITFIAGFRCHALTSRRRRQRGFQRG
jgi:hypothetical protein